MSCYELFGINDNQNSNQIDRILISRWKSSVLDNSYRGAKTGNFHGSYNSSSQDPHK